MIAYCYASGRIGFGEKCPSTALAIISGDSDVMDIVRATARLARDNDTFLVPQVVDANIDGKDGVDGLIKFCKIVERNVARRQKAQA